MAAAAADDLSDDELDAGVEAPIHMRFLLRVGCRNTLGEIDQQIECAK